MKTKALAAVMVLVGVLAMAEEPSIPMLLTAKEKAWVDRRRIPISEIVAKAKLAQEERLAKMTKEERAEYDRVAKLPPNERMLEMEKRRLVRLTNEVVTVKARITDMAKTIADLKPEPVKPVVEPIDKPVVEPVPK